MYLMRWLVFIPLLADTGFQSQIPEIIFFYLVCSTVFIAAAGYVINDYFDIKIASFRARYFFCPLLSLYLSG